MKALHRIQVSFIVDVNASSLKQAKEKALDALRFQPPWYLASDFDYITKFAKAVPVKPTRKRRKKR